MEKVKGVVMKRFLVAIDLWDETNRVLEYAKKLATEFNGKLCVVHSETPESYIPSYDTEFEPELSINNMEIMKSHEKMIKHRFDKIKADLKNDNIESAFVLMEGSTAKNILKEVKEFNADLIIIGSHKHGRFYNLIFGGVHDVLINRSNIPIFIIPAENKENDK